MKIVYLDNKIADQIYNFEVVLPAPARLFTKPHETRILPCLKTNAFLLRFKPAEMIYLHQIENQIKTKNMKFTSGFLLAFAAAQGNFKGYEP